MPATLSKPTARNHHGAPAHSLPQELDLALLACTGSLGETFYARPEEQRSRLILNAFRVRPVFLAKTALFARRHGYMKSTPALLCAVLSRQDGALLDRIFHQVIDNGRMLRNFVEEMRCGAVGRRSLGRRGKRLVQAWFDRRSPAAILRASVGNKPSLADVIRLAHVRPGSPDREALFAWILGRPFDLDAAPPILQALLEFQRTGQGEPPNVPFQLLTAASPSRETWVSIAKNARWQMTRMNLNTFHRQGVLSEPGMVELIAGRLRDPDTIRSARAFPYQLMTALHRIRSTDMPAPIIDACASALETALANVPVFPGKTYVAVDVSGSMGCSVMPGSATRCVDVAAMVAAAILRRNPWTEILPFDTEVHRGGINKNGSIAEITGQIVSMYGGGTACSAPLRLLNKERAKGSLVFLISDNESWADPAYVKLPGLWRPGRTITRHVHPHTALVAEWLTFRQRNPGARMVCLDIVPYRTVQAPPAPDILHVGGFSDTVFSVISDYASGALSADALTARINETPLG